MNDLTVVVFDTNDNCLASFVVPQAPDKNEILYLDMPEKKLQPYRVIERHWTYKLTYSCNGFFTCDLIVVPIEREVIV